MSRGSLTARRDLVLLHGWGMHGGIFEPLLAALPKGIGARTIDLPGHGARAARPVPATLEDWAEAVLAEAPPRASWLGWSLGGLVALAAARLAPERVERLILVASAPRLTPAPDWPEGIDPTLLADFAAGLEADWEGTLERFLALEALGSGRAGAELRFLRERLAARRPAPSALARGLEILAAADLRGAARSLGKPSLWIAGANDRIVPPAAVAAGAALAGGRLLAVPRAGHAPFLGRPTEVAAELLGFLAA